MENIVFIFGSLLFSTAIVAAAVLDPGDGPPPWFGLDDTGSQLNISDTLKFSEEGEDAAIGYLSSITKRDVCFPTISCIRAGGYCVEKNKDCEGTLDASGCKGKKCKCCIPDDTTPAPKRGPIVICPPGDIEEELQRIDNNQKSTHSKLDFLIKHLGIQEVGFSSNIGAARASSIWDNRFRAEYGFARPAACVAWCSVKDGGFPQSIWYEFEIVQRVVQYSFQSRLDGGSNEVWLGPSKYEFWGSNDYDCSKTETRVTLIEDNSGTPFTLENIPKVGNVENPHKYRCYGFTINATPDRQFTCMSNIRLFYIRGNCPDGNGFEEIGGTCYYFSSEQGVKRNWDQSRKFCQDLSGQEGMNGRTSDLAELLRSESSGISDGLLMEKIRQKGEWGVWLGGSDAETENSWIWVTSGRSLSLDDSFWHSSQPNSVGGHSGDCLVGFIHGGKPYFGDWPCINQHSFVCQLF